MKRIRTIIAAAVLLLVSVAASAQRFGGPRDYGYGYGGRRTTFLGGGVTHFHAGVNPLTLTYKSNGAYNNTYGMGLDLGMASMIPMAPAVPFYLEVGFGAQYSFGSLPNPAGALLEAVDKKIGASSFGIKIPVNFAYFIEFGRSDVAVIPYAGIGVLGNISGKVKVNSTKFDLYDSESPVEGNRFVLGGQFGCRFAFHRFLVGVGYEHSFTKVAPHISASQVALSVGVIL